MKGREWKRDKNQYTDVVKNESRSLRMSLERELHKREDYSPFLTLFSKHSRLLNISDVL